MMPTDLNEHLVARQLSTQGNKEELLARLAATHMTSQVGVGVKVQDNCISDSSPLNKD
jgi:hypothetical protein